MKVDDGNHPLADQTLHYLTNLIEVLLLGINKMLALVEGLIVRHDAKSLRFWHSELDMTSFGQELICATFIYFLTP